MIKLDQSFVGNIDFKIESIKGNNFFYFLLFFKTYIYSYLWKYMSDFDGVFSKMKLM